MSVDTEQRAAPDDLEEGQVLQIDFEKLQKIAQTGAAVVPVAVQDADTGVLMLIGYANDLALQHTLAHGVATFWSTSRNELWVKGAISGDMLEVVEVRVNCEQNSLLYLVRPLGQGVCHTRNAAGQSRPTCYYRKIQEGQLVFVEGLA